MCVSVWYLQLEGDLFLSGLRRSVEVVPSPVGQGRQIIPHLLPHVFLPQIQTVPADTHTHTGKLDNKHTNKDG